MGFPPNTVKSSKQIKLRGITHGSTSWIAIVFIGRSAALRSAKDPNDLWWRQRRRDERDRGSTVMRPSPISSTTSKNSAVGFSKTRSSAKPERETKRPARDTQTNVSPSTKNDLEAIASSASPFNPVRSTDKRARLDRTIKFHFVRTVKIDDCFIVVHFIYADRTTQTPTMTTTFPATIPVRKPDDRDEIEEISDAKNVGEKNPTVHNNDTAVPNDSHGKSAIPVAALKGPTFYSPGRRRRVLALEIRRSPEDNRNRVLTSETRLSPEQSRDRIVALEAEIAKRTAAQNAQNEISRVARGVVGGTFPTRSVPSGGSTTPSTKPDSSNKSTIVVSDVASSVSDEMDVVLESARSGGRNRRTRRRSRGKHLGHGFLRDGAFVGRFRGRSGCQRDRHALSVAADDVHVSVREGADVHGPHDDVSTKETKDRARRIPLESVL